jgi:hypothetical protein
MVEGESFEPNLKKMLKGVVIAAIFVEVSELPRHSRTVEGLSLVTVAD